MKTARVKIVLEYQYNEQKDDNWIMRDLMNMELPSNYAEDSFEIIEIVKEQTMIIADTPQKIDLYQMLVLRKALELEIEGIRMSRGRTAYSAIKHLFNIKGNRQKVLDTFNEIIEATKQPEREQYE